MLCAISGEAPQVPVVSRKSGNVFEKRTIEAYIAEHGSDPVSGEDLTLEDLIELKSPRIVTPRPPNLTSIPSLLSTFQAEWDAIILETFTLKQQLSQTRQELSTALYQNDAATRVIARLSRERDEAREALSNVTISGGGAASNGDAMQVDGQALPDDLVQKIDTTQQHLFNTRRTRATPDGWATGDDISAFDLTTSTDPLYPGSTAISLNNSGELALFGGADGEAGVYSLSQKKVVHGLKCGSAVTATTWWGARAVIGTSAGVVKVFEDGHEIAQFGSHVDAVTSIALHPSGAILATASADKRYAFYDLGTFKKVSEVYTDAEISCSAFHVDGLLYFTGGTDGSIRISDVKNGSAIANLSTSGPVRAIAFSENGTWFATAEKDSSTVGVWDLRKQAVIKQLDVGGPVDSLRFDYTGRFLATAGPSSVTVQQYTKAGKTWSEPLRKAVAARDIAWGANASSLVALTPEGGVQILSAP
ncbi:Prp19-domain-containing protein [Corynespora cassiicola Philippines]|uniref:Pre-mRNA-processing factor 19 n=1 Tax=Corynespora cassiicola Philippines TaxID=1448308 RepID=A0A2T2NMG4_CORCC|nr:Prp19-domain-containing protein [Corynespora cassiicola Philippines]